MRAQERIYRALLLAHPRSHRREYGDAMTQLMRDRVRDEGGGLRTLMVWSSLLVDLARSATVEWMSLARLELRTGWWRIGSLVVGAVLAVVTVQGLFEPATGPWYKYTFGRLALLLAPIAIVAGLSIRRRHRWQGSSLVAVGVLPGAFAVVLFWFPPFLLFGVFSILVATLAADDAHHARRAGLANPAVPVHVPSSAWSAPAEPEDAT